MQSDQKVYAATHALMRSLGMTTVFGNPGSTELKFFREWPADFRYVLGLQESCCVAMADGYAQATRRGAFVSLHSAAGVGHAMGSIFTAYRNHTPLVITAGQQTRAMFPTDPYLYAARATEFPQPYVKWSVEPARAADVPAAIARAYYIAMQRPRGPVFVSIPEDDWDQTAEPVALRGVTFDIAPHPAAIAALARALDLSKAPVIVVGAAVDQDDAWSRAVALAERLEAPVWASPMSARASFPENHRLFAGFLPPLRQPLADKLKSHDVILVLGAPVFTYHVHTGGQYVSDRTSLWLLSDDPDHIARAPLGNAIACSMSAGIDALLNALLARARVQAQPITRPAPPPVSREPTGASLMHAIARCMPEDAVIVEEAPTHRHVLHDFLPIKSSGGFYAGASGGLGWAVAAAIGVARAQTHRKVICLAGDGSSLYSIQSVWTAVQEKLPIAFVIFNNRGYGALKSFGKMMGVVHAPGNDLEGIDFVSLARGFGCDATRVTLAEEVEPQLRRAFAANVPMLIDVHLAEPVERLY